MEMEFEEKIALTNIISEKLSDQIIEAEQKSAICSAFDTIENRHKEKKSKPSRYHCKKLLKSENQIFIKTEVKINSIRGEI